MKKVILLIVLAIICSCGRIDDTTQVKDYGKVKIGNNLYIKKLYINNDRIYLLVDGNDHLVSGNVSTSYIVNKTTNSNAVISN